MNRLAAKSSEEGILPVVAVTTLEWILISGLGLIYLALIFTVASLTLRKGYMGLFIAGFFFPILWLIGTMLRPKPGSKYDGPSMWSA